MEITKKSNYLPGGAIVLVKSIKDWDCVGVVIHPATLPKEVTVKGWRSSDPLHDYMPIVRTAGRYHRLNPSEEIEVLYEPVDSMEFKPKETVLYAINKSCDE